MRVNQSQTRTQFPLSPKKILKKTIGRTLSLAAVFLALWGFIVFSFASTDPKNDIVDTLTKSAGLMFFGILILAFIVSYLYERWYFAVYFYDLTPDFIQIKKGPITPSEITLPYERVQDVYVDQDILDRIFGLYDVHLSSATVSSGVAAHIDGVEQAAAEGLRDILLQTVRERITKK